MVLADALQKTDLISMKGNSKRVKCMVTVEHFLTGVATTKVSGKTTSGKAKVNSSMKMAMFSKETGSKATLMVSLPSRRRVRLLPLVASGTKAESMAKENLGISIEA